MVDDRKSLLALGTHSPRVHLLLFNLLFKNRPRLLRAAERVARMAQRCQKCGVTGFAELLEYCRKCGTAAEHRYCLEKLPKPAEKVFWTCEGCKSRNLHKDSLEKLAVDSGCKNVSRPKNPSGVASSKRKMLEVEDRPGTSPDQDGDRKLKKCRRLILADADEDLVDQALQAKGSVLEARKEPTQRNDDQGLRINACPIYDHAWRGYIVFGEEKFGPIRAHLSSLACQRVATISKSLPPIIHMKKLSGLDFLPDSLKSSPLTDDKIGLFFLPESSRVDTGYRPLLGDATEKNVIYTCLLDEAELLLFSSAILPRKHHRFQGKYYFWGAFRRRQVPAVSSSADCRAAPSEVREGTGKDLVAAKDTRDKEEKGQAEESDGSQNYTIAVSPASVLQLPTSREPQEREGCDKYEKGEERVGEKGKNSGGLSYRKDLPALPPADDENTSWQEEPEEGEIWEDYEERGKGEKSTEFNEDRGLSLFPLAGEDMAIASRLGSHHKVNLDLSL